jgi:hypothetical protein
MHRCIVSLLPVFFLCIKTGFLAAAEKFTLPGPAQALFLAEPALAPSRKQHYPLQEGKAFQQFVCIYAQREDYSMALESVNSVIYLPEEETVLVWKAAYDTKKPEFYSIVSLVTIFFLIYLIISL